MIIIAGESVYFIESKNMSCNKCCSCSLQATCDPTEPKFEQMRSVSAVDVSSTTGHIYHEIGEPLGEGSTTSHLQAPETRQRRTSLVLLAAPYLDSIKKNIERRKSEISIHLPPIPLLTQRRKSEASIRHPPEITVTDAENQEDQEADMSSAEDIINIGTDEIYENDVEPEENETTYNKCLSILILIVVFSWKLVKTPWRLWRKSKCMPSEEEISKLIISGETKSKFSKIDIGARRYFPVAFCFLMTGYWILYMYYITDEFPAKDVNPLLLKSKCHV